MSAEEFAQQLGLDEPSETASDEPTLQDCLDAVVAQPTKEAIFRLEDYFQKAATESHAKVVWLMGLIAAHNERQFDLSDKDVHPEAVAAVEGWYAARQQAE